MIASGGAFRCQAPSLVSGCLKRRRRLNSIQTRATDGGLDAVQNRPGPPAACFIIHQSCRGLSASSRPLAQYAALLRRTTVDPDRGLVGATLARGMSLKEAADVRSTLARGRAPNPCGGFAGAATRLSIYRPLRK
jgi:hypothetical protein